MSDPIEVTTTADLPVGRVKAFRIGGKTIAVYHTATGFYASDNTCPHRGGPLNEGDLMGNEIVCPWHLWGFDVATGLCNGNPDIAIATHPVQVDGERILVTLT